MGEIVIMSSNVFCNLQSDFITDMKCSNLYVNARPSMVTLDYTLDMSILAKLQDETHHSKKIEWDSSNK